MLLRHSSAETEVPEDDSDTAGSVDAFLSHKKVVVLAAVQKTVELSLVQHIERIVEVTVVITAPNTKPAAVAVHRQVLEIIDIPLVTQTVSTNRKIQLRRHRRWDPSRWVRLYGANSP